MEENNIVCGSVEVLKIIYNEYLKNYSNLNEIIYQPDGTSINVKYIISYIALAVEINQLNNLSLPINLYIKYLKNKGCIETYNYGSINLITEITSSGIEIVELKNQQFNNFLKEWDKIL